MDDRIAYDRALDRYRVSRIVEEDTLKAGWEKGLKAGLEKGLKEGRAKGLVEGREEGRAKEKSEIARNMKRFGMPIEQISLITGLSKDEIEGMQ